MTREEAITKLKKFCHNCEKFPTCVNTDKECFKALVMAIKALEQEPCEDAISREAALQAVSKGCQEWRGIYGRCEEFINALPPITLQQKIGHWNSIPKYPDIAWSCSECGAFYNYEA